MPKRIEEKAMSVAKQYLESQGYRVKDVSTSPARHGYDLIATRRQENLKVEVKGCTRMWQIPDLFESEFQGKKGKKRLTADLLCVVYFTKSEQPKVCMIPREEIPPEYVTLRRAYRISSKFKKQRVLRRFLKDRRDAATVRPPSSHAPAS
jgi:Holliday junction resolvase-like predicted endonuclease